MIDITTYRPTEGADLAIKVINDRTNICGDVAYALYERYARECDDQKRTKIVYGKGRAFQFSNGLVFGLFDTAEGLAIELYVPPESGVDKQAALLSVVPWLKATGINDDAALTRLEKDIEQLQSPPLEARML